MKIAVFHNLPSGGAKRALYGNVKFLAKEHEVDVVVPSTANEEYLPLKDIVNNLKVFPVKNNLPGFIYSALKYFPSKVSLNDLKKTQKIMAEYVNKKDYDVVLCEQDRHTMAPFILKYLKKPLVYYCQQPNCFRYDISRKLYKEAGLEYKNIIEGLYLRIFGSKLIKHDKKYANYSKYMVSNSNFSKEIIFKMYGISSLVSYLGVDNRVFRPIDILKENFVLSVGQCIPEKGFEFIVKSIAMIDVDLRPDFVLVTDHGNIHWKNYLEKLAIKLNVKLNILNLITDEELNLLYNQAKMVVYTPYMEPFGLVPLEAMSSGTPVVGINEGGVMETVINGKTGILTERDHTIFAKGVETLLTNQNMSDKFIEESIVVSNNYWTLENSGKRLLNHLKQAKDVYND
ncbi:glycosyltransferase family 1 protein [Methanobacterium sp. SMA-27]|uniref:glycosyltransferase family 1 protein n=1 Tax=Methanobacterium sp. SMA-27 TaxID=1495336 RepID=UPI00064E634F|nr:glycosyltransferase [Methanobacterium sp. SMA-27]